eukprot:6174936-Pleurochrysis_carterae.AAC.2
MSRIDPLLRIAYRLRHQRPFKYIAMKSYRPVVTSPKWIGYIHQGICPPTPMHSKRWNSPLLCQITVTSISFHSVGASLKKLL